MASPFRYAVKLRCIAGLQMVLSGPSKARSRRQGSAKSKSLFYFNWMPAGGQRLPVLHDLMSDRRKATKADPARQIAALPLKVGDDGLVQVLMVTSRGTQRWVVPKGWTMDGKKPWRAAEIEALEEAGAEGYIGSEALGTYRYNKELDDGHMVPVEVQLYPMMVARLRKRWKERRDRKRRWFSLTGAAKRVDEPELKAILTGLAVKPHKHPGLRKMLKHR